MIDSNMRIQTGRAYLAPTTFQPVALSVLRRMLERASDLVSRHHPDAGRRSIHMAALELFCARRAD